MTSAATDFAATGRLWLRKSIPESDLSAYDRAAETSDRPGVRLGLSDAFGPEAPLARVLAAVLPGYHAVRALAFNKSASSNWGVSWHQDRTVPFAARHDVAGFGNWTCKAGVWHCEPPLALLNQMVFVRVHLDPSGADSGPMEIAPGSHHRGILPSADAETAANAYPTEVCLAERGDVLILHMLILHCSRPAARATARRTLRVDYAGCPLPAPLMWAL
jgi:hypothetical protein